MLHAWERNFFKKDERRAARERFRQMQNERHAAWELSGKCKTSAALHGSAPEKWKTSATLHGNAFFVSMVQQGLPKGAPLKPSKPFKIKCLGVFWSSIGAADMATKKMDERKWTPKSAHLEGAKY